MPGMNGMDLIAEARQLRPDLPALIISGYMDLKETGFLAGSITRLRKPFQRDALISAIRQALEPKVPDRARRKGRTTKVNPN